MRLPDASPRSEAKKTAFPAILASTLVPRGADYPRIAPKSPANHPLPAPKSPADHPLPDDRQPPPPSNAKISKEKGFPRPFLKRKQLVSWDSWTVTVGQ